MHTRSFLLGLAAGLLVGVAVAGAIPKWRANQVPVRVTLCTDPLLQSIEPRSDLYAFKFDGQDFGSVTVKDGRLDQLLFLDWPNHRQICIRSKAGRLFGEISFDRMRLDDPYLAEVSTIDQDADGIPDEMVEWNHGQRQATILVRDTITWKPKPRLTSSAASP